MCFLWTVLSVCSREDGDVVVYLGLSSLCHTLGDPDDVAALLLLQFDVGIKHAEVELLQEGEHVELDL